MFKKQLPRSVIIRYTILLSTGLALLLWIGNTPPTRDHTKRSPLSTQPRKKVVLVFSGVFGEKDSCSDIVKELANDGFQHIFLSQQSARTYSFHDHWDDWYMALFKRRLGFGAVERQATYAHQRIRGLIGNQDEVYLVCHSQGGLVGLSFWRQYRKIYDIKSMAILVAPLQGAPYTESISNLKALSTAFRYGRAEGNYGYYLNYFVLYSRALLMQTLGSTLIPGIMDTMPQSRAIAQLGEVYEEMKQTQFPLFVVVASSNHHFRWIKSSYGTTGANYLISRGAPNDNFIATASQYPHITWPQLQILKVVARHSNAGNGPGADPDVRQHPEVLKQISTFFSKASSNKEA